MLQATPFTGQSRSYTIQRGPRRYPECRSCGSSLHGRREATRFATVYGVRYLVEQFRCRCGTGRRVRRAVSA
jgi:hypothetical protein